MLMPSSHWSVDTEAKCILKKEQGKKCCTFLRQPFSKVAVLRVKQKVAVTHLPEEQKPIQGAEEEEEKLYQGHGFIIQVQKKTILKPGEVDLRTEGTFKEHYVPAGWRSRWLQGRLGT